MSGRCVFCGFHNNAHRCVDTQMERVMAGEPIESVAADYDLDVRGLVTSWAKFLETIYERHEDGL